jgi:hypothetical protein
MEKQPSTTPRELAPGDELTCSSCNATTTAVDNDGLVYALHERPDGSACLMSGTLVSSPAADPADQGKAPACFLAIGPNCWGTGVTASGAKREALKFTARSNGPKVGVYRLPPGATASVDGLGRIEVEGGDGSTPVHVLGPHTIEWGPMRAPAPEARHGHGTFKARKLDALALGSLSRPVTTEHLLADACELSTYAPRGVALAVKAFGTWYPAKLVRRKSTGSLVVELITAGTKTREKTVQLVAGVGEAESWRGEPVGSVVSEPGEGTFDDALLRWLAVSR